MRGYETQWGVLENGVITKQVSYNACWSTVPYGAEKTIIIDNFNDELTKEHQKRLLWIINKITPCSKVTVNNKEYISIKLLPKYNNSLILLNFIRNLWHRPNGPGEYTEKFFKALKDSRGKIKDPVERLTTANKIACEGWLYGSDHSNVAIHSKMAIRTLPELVDSDIYSTQDWLMGKDYKKTT